MAITVGGVTSGGATAASMVVSKPSGLADGDVLLLSAYSATARTLTPPAGWSLRSTVAYGAGDRTTWLFVKVVTTAAGEPSTYTFTKPSSGAHNYVCTAVSGVDITSPFDIASDELSGLATNEESLVFSGVTIKTADAMLVLCLTVAANNLNLTSPSGMVQSAYVGSPFSGAMFTERISTGATGGRMVTVTTLAGGILTALRPASTAADHPLAGDAVATSAATATTLTISHPLAGSATATSSATAGRLTLSHSLTGHASSQSSATTTTLHLSHPLAGSVAAESLGIAAGLILSHPLSGEAIAITSASADLTSLLPYNPPGKATRTMRAGIVATRTQRPTITATRVQRGG